MTFLESPRRCVKCLGTGSNSVSYGMSGNTTIPYSTGNCTVCDGTGVMNHSAIESQMNEVLQNGQDSDSSGGGLGNLIMPGIVAIILWACYHFSH